MLKSWVCLILSALYLLNFTVGVFELPDNLPVVGNLDELAASGLLLHSLRRIREERQRRRAGPGTPPLPPA